MLDELEIRAAVVDNPHGLSALLLGQTAGLCRRAPAAGQGRAGGGTAHRCVGTQSTQEVAGPASRRLNLASQPASHGILFADQAPRNRLPDAPAAIDGEILAGDELRTG